MTAKTTTPVPAKPAPCPNCGRPCLPVAYGPDTPPFCCYECRLGWWQAEIGAGKDWDRKRRGFPRGHGVHAAVNAERAAAHEQVRLR